MSEEIINRNEQLSETAGTTETIPEKPDYRAGFKSVSLKLGLMIIFIFAFRGIGTIVASLLAPSLADFDPTTVYIINTVISLIFLYVCPIVATLLIFKMPLKKINETSYQKPKYFGRSLGMFPALYSLGIITNLLTMLVSKLFKEPDMNESFNTVNDLSAPNMTCAVILFVQLAIIAPLVEELWFRGIVLESMRPYGNGVAIFISGLLFGLTHANFAQFFYATVIGICLGYVAVSTKSIIPTTVLHAMFNSVAATLLLLLADKNVGDFLLNSIVGKEAVYTPAVVIFLVLLVLMTLTIIVGLFMAISKLIKIKKYRVPKVQEELSPAKRWGLFFSSVTVIIGLVLAADTFTFRFITNLIFKGICAVFGITNN